MTIWILALLVLASEVGLGLRQGAIRVAFAFVGIVLGAALALPLGHLIRPLLAAMHVKQPFILWFGPPVIVFLILLIVFKVAGFAVHRKVQVFYKYKAGDLRLALWTRLNSRLGMCLGLANGVAYLVLVSFALYVFGYWSVQLATAPSNPRVLKLLNQLSADLADTGMARVGMAIESLPPVYFEAADLAGLLYNNPDLKNRLYNYPLSIQMEEQSDFEGLANSSQLAQEWRDQAPILQLIKSPSVDAILKNPEMLDKFWSTMQPNLQDLEAYLKTGESPLYDPETILGRWTFDVNGTIGLIRRARPNMTSKEMAQLKNLIALSYANTTFVAMPDHGSIIKSYPRVKLIPGQPPTTEMVNLSGQWSSADGKYLLKYSPEGKSEEAPMEVEGARLTIRGPGLELAFERES